MDYSIHMYQNGRFIPVMFYQSVSELIEITYANYSNGVWHGIVWTGGVSEVCINMVFLVGWIGFMGTFTENGELP